MENITILDGFHLKNKIGRRQNKINVHDERIIVQYMHAMR